MEWIATISEWSKTLLEGGGGGMAAVLLAFLLGVVGAVTSACCALPVVGAVVGYAGTREASDSRASLLGAISFMLGSIIALLVLGGVAGLVGKIVQSSLGSYWRLFAGIAAIMFGLGALNLLPLNLPQRKVGKAHPRGLAGAMLFGLIMGGAVVGCSMACCNPGIFIILGAAVLQGCTFWMISALAAYAIGFSLPLTALLLGVSLGKAVVNAGKVDAAIRIIAGVLLICAGFYFLSTF
ncbi:MAG: hypothetical protein HY770_02375 [Chitinivibrionia bacterium]|nr:hypothetical protein [Chitinivibrionia bacterium]